MAYRKGDYWMCKIPVGLREIAGSSYRKLGKISAMVKKEAEKTQTLFLLELEVKAEEFIDIQDYQYMTVYDLLDYWLKNHARIKRSEKTVENDVYTIKKLVEVLGEISIHDLDHRDINRYMAVRRSVKSYRSRQKEGVSETAIHHELRILKHACKLALERWCFTLNDPFKKVEMPSGNVKRKRYLLKAEEDSLNEAINAKLLIDPSFIWFVHIWSMALSTGIRASNLCDIRWSHVTLGEKGGIYLPKTKNKLPHVVPFNQNSAAIVIEIVQLRGGKLKPSDFLFVDGEGSRLTRNRVSTEQLKLCRSAGIEDYRWHDNRHDCFSKMAQAGKSGKHIQQFSGHLDAQSLNRYLHLAPEEKWETVRSLPDRFIPATKRLPKSIGETG